MLLEISRKQAFISHLTISLMVFFALIYYIVYEWYPSYYFYIDGGIRGILTIFFVDVVIGPGLTFFLFKPGKPGLKFDMSMVILFQLCALIWGVHNVYTERPSMTVFYNGQFNCLNQEDVIKVQKDKFLMNEKPVLAVLKRPDNIDDYLDMMHEAMGNGSSEIHYFGDKFVPMDAESLQHVLKFKLYINKDNMRLMKENETAESLMARWKEYLSLHPGYLDSYKFYPLDCRYGKVLAVFDPDNKRIIDTVPIYTEAAEAKINMDIDIMNILINSMVNKIIGDQ